MNTEAKPRDSAAEELSWKAFLYVSGELTPDETVDFEERLLSDQAAREAVALAAKLTDGVMTGLALDSATSKSVQKSVTGWKLAARWMVGGVAAASLAFGFGWWSAVVNRVPEREHVASGETEEPATNFLPVVEPSVEDSGQLLQGWSDSKDLVTDLDVITEEPLTEDFSASPEAETENSFAWMLAAVTEDTPRVDPKSEVMEN